jgi:hypothetical protein
MSKVLNSNKKCEPHEIQFFGHLRESHGARTVNGLSMTLYVYFLYSLGLM